MSAIDVRVSGAEDALGNAQFPSTLADKFNIDMTSSGPSTPRLAQEAYWLARVSSEPGETFQLVGWVESASPHLDLRSTTLSTAGSGGLAKLAHPTK